MGGPLIETAATGWPSESKIGAATQAFPRTASWLSIATPTRRTVASSRSSRSESMIVYGVSGFRPEAGRLRSGSEVPNAISTLPSALAYAGHRPPVRVGSGNARYPTIFTKYSTSVPSSTPRWIVSCVSSNSSSRAGREASRRSRRSPTSSPSSNRRMPKLKPVVVRFSSRCSTSTLASRCTVGFGIAVREASSASVSSVCSALKQSSSMKTRTSTDLGATSCRAAPISVTISPYPVPSCVVASARSTTLSDQVRIRPIDTS